MKKRKYTAPNHAFLGRNGKIEGTCTVTSFGNLANGYIKYTNVSVRIKHDD